MRREPDHAGPGRLGPHQLRLGYDVDENAIRFSNYFHLLRELVHLSAGWLAMAPEFEVKYALGDHLHDDARAISEIRRRLYELRHPSDYPGAPAEELADLLDRLDQMPTPTDYLEHAYGMAKPALLRAFRVHLENLDPVSDEPSLRLLTQLVEQQERHVAALGGSAEPGGGPPAIDDLGALPIRLKAEPRALRIMPPLVEPARDDYVEVTPGGDPFLARELYVNDPDENHVPIEPEEQRHFFHGLMDAEICAAELMARNSHEHPEMPWDFHVDMARQAWDEMRHAKLHSLLMPKELGCRWGDYPVGFSYFRSVYAHDLLDRLALFNSTSEQKAMWRHSHRRKVLVERGQVQIAQVFDYLLADEVPHVHNGSRWGTYLCGGDEAAYKAKIRELRAELDETGMPAPNGRREPIPSRTR
jgi:hypothetical protein